MGRSLYEIKVQPYLAEITQWMDEFTEAEIAEKLKVRPETFSRYKKQYPELAEAIENSKGNLIKELKSNLKKSAKGFYYEEVKTVKIHNPDDEAEQEWIEKIEVNRKYSKPDVVACNMLLKNLDDEWRQDDYISTQLKKKTVDLQEKKIEMDNW